VSAQEFEVRDGSQSTAHQQSVSPAMIQMRSLIAFGPYDPCFAALTYIWHAPSIAPEHIPDCLKTTTGSAPYVIVGYSLGERFSTAQSVA